MLKHRESAWVTDINLLERRSKKILLDIHAFHKRLLFLLLVELPFDWTFVILDINRPPIDNKLRMVALQQIVAVSSSEQ